MRIFTRTGDAGETGLWGGRRVSKDAPRVEATGAVDELNAHLGAARALLADGDLAALLGRLQNELFDLGGDLAAALDDAGERPGVVRVRAEQVARLEAEIDVLEQGLPPLRRFILPGGSPAAAALHIARAVCRRAERRVVALSRLEAINPEVLRYLNRLSDLLFVLARTANARQGIAESVWEPERA